jgi:hypothetical protein
MSIRANPRQLGGAKPCVQTNLVKKDGRDWQVAAKNHSRHGWLPGFFYFSAKVPGTKLCETEKYLAPGVKKEDFNA